jgi:hypothetical protein
LRPAQAFTSVLGDREAALARRGDFTSKDLQVNISHEVRKIFKCFVINNLFRLIDAAIQGSVACED